MENIKELEKLCIEKLMLKKACAPDKWSETPEFWFQFGLSQIYSIGMELETIKRENLWYTAILKDDNTPAIRFELQIEKDLKKSIRSFNKKVAVCGEETGGNIPDKGYAIAVDPIDGTWAFLAGLSSYASSLTVYKDKGLLMSFVLNNSTGEIAVAGKGLGARIIKVDSFDRYIYGTELPLKLSTSDDKLITMHSQRDMREKLDILLKAFESHKLDLVTTATGSPSWMLLQAAKGCFTYVHSWSKAASKPFDLAPGILLIREAGGDVIDLKGNSIDGDGHIGMFIASTNKTFLAELKDLLSS